MDATLVEWADFATFVATDSADILKVGYARKFTSTIQRAEGTVIPVNFIVGSGFFHSSPDDVSTVIRTATWRQLKIRFWSRRLLYLK